MVNRGITVIETGSRFSRRSSIGDRLHEIGAKRERSHGGDDAEIEGRDERPAMQIGAGTQFCIDNAPARAENASRELVSRAQMSLTQSNRRAAYTTASIFSRSLGTHVYYICIYSRVLLRVRFKGG